MSGVTMDNILVIIFELSINFFESYLMIDFISKYNGFKFYGTKRYILFTGAVLAIFINVTAMNYIESFIEAASYISLVIMILYSLYALKGKVKIKLFTCI